MPRDERPPMAMPDGRPLEAQPKWRRDFPILVPRDDELTRRDFAKFLVLTSGAFACGQAWIGLQSLRRTPPDATRTIARLDDVPVGGVVAFEYPDAHDACLLVRPDRDTLVAFSQRCTHLACPVLPQVEQGRFHCPCHEGYFDLRTGQPLAGPPRRPLPRITLEVRDGLVLATGVELST